MTSELIAPDAKEPNAEGIEVHHHNVPIVNVVEEGKGLDEETLEEIEREKEAVLLEVDEADSLFGKRTGVKDGHGRY